MDNIIDITVSDIFKIVFLRADYLPYVLMAAAGVLACYGIYTGRILKVYAYFGGYKLCRKKARKNGSSIPGPIRLIGKSLFMAAVTLILGFALMKPAIKNAARQNIYEPAIIIIALDQTISMLAEDVPPARIEAAKLEVNNLLDRLESERGTDKVGLLTLTDIAQPTEAVPTHDYDVIRDVHLRKMTDENLKRYETHGTNLWDGITWGLKYFDPKDELAKILIIISDGEQVAETEYINETRAEALNAVNKHPDASIFIVGIGSTTEPALIPKERDTAGRITEYYVQTKGPQTGAFIMTQPDPWYLKSVAGQVNGQFIQTETGTELSEALNDILDTERKVIGMRTDTEFRDITPLFIVSALIFLFFVPFAKL